MSYASTGGVEANIKAALESDRDLIFIDGKADSATIPAIYRVMRRHDLTKQECARRGVRFLPAQVLRPIFAANEVL